MKRILITAAACLLFFQCTDNRPCKLSYYDLMIWEIVRREGVRLEAYDCPAGYRTIGIGTRTDTIDRVTLAEAKNMLRADIQARYEVIHKLLPGYENHEILAIAMFAHNLGLTRVLKSEQWTRFKNRTQDLDSMWLEYCYYKEDGSWRKSDNLVQARQFEVALFNLDTAYLNERREFLCNHALKSYIEAQKKPGR